MDRWQPGNAIVIRDIQRGRIRAAVTMVVVEDTPARLVTWLPNGSPFFLAADASGRPMKTLEFDHLVELKWQAFGGPLYIWYTGKPLLFRIAWDGEGPSRHLDHWYVNLQSPLRRKRIGFDASDHALDIVIQPDLKSWAGKDEAEFEARITGGWYTPSEAAAIRGAGTRAVERAHRREPPFDEDWEPWRPDPSWRVPALLEGWDRL